MQRSRSGRFVSRRRTHRRFRVNPSPRVARRPRRAARRVVRAARRRNPMRGKHHSPAMRRKIGLAVKRAMAGRRSGGGSMTVIRSSRRRRGGSVSRGSFGGGSLTSSFKSALSKPLLMKAGGAVLASFGTGYILNRWGSQLPLANNQYGRIIYTLGLPVLGAYLIRKKNRDIAEGLVIGGLVMTINSLMSGIKTAAVAAPATTAAVGSYGVAGELGSGTFGYYPQGMHDSAGLGGGNVAFPASAW